MMKLDYLLGTEDEADDALTLHSLATDAMMDACTDANRELIDEELSEPFRANAVIGNSRKFGKGKRCAEIIVFASPLKITLEQTSYAGIVKVATLPMGTGDINSASETDMHSSFLVSKLEARLRPPTIATGPLGLPPHPDEMLRMLAFVGIGQTMFHASRKLINRGKNNSYPENTLISVSHDTETGYSYVVDIGVFMNPERIVLEQVDFEGNFWKAEVRAPEEMIKNCYYSDFPIMLIASSLIDRLAPSLLSNSELSKGTA